MSEAVIGYGSTFKAGDGGSPESFTAVAEVFNIQPAEKAVEPVETTHLSSPDAHKEYKPGMVTPGQWSIECRWLFDDATQDDSADGLLGILYSREVRNWQFEDPDGNTEEFTGFITNYAPSAVEGESPMNLSVTFQVTGKSTRTAAAV